ncbi:MAG TPA: chemotaxis protein CheC [Candidatus Saccharimonadales bacterium]|nr:chemotaxis protein CheC [Candidatus Saccharimonadales bacterium]
MEQGSILEPVKEVASIAAGNAATALSKLVGQQVVVAVPSVTLLPVEQISQDLGPSAQLSSAGIVKIDGDVQGLILLSFTPSDAKVVAADIATKQTGSTYQDADQSVLREMVNIVSGAALTALENFIGLHFTQSVPVSTTDMLGALLDPLLAEQGATYDHLLVIQEVCTVAVKGVSLKLLIVLDPPSTTKVTQKLAEKLNGPHV